MLESMVFFQTVPCGSQKAVPLAMVLAGGRVVRLRAGLWFLEGERRPSRKPGRSRLPATGRMPRRSSPVPAGPVMPWGSLLDLILRDNPDATWH